MILKLVILDPVLASFFKTVNRSYFFRACFLPMAAALRIQAVAWTLAKGIMEICVQKKSSDDLKNLTSYNYSNKNSELEEHL